MKLFWLFFLLCGLCRVTYAHVPPEREVPLPLWEAGVLAGGGYTPDYPAAGQNHWRGLGAPYIIYRGLIFRADRDGARARLIRTPWYQVEFSAAGSLPARSKDNDARDGMPNLDWLGEIGPRLTIPLWKAWGYTPLKFYLPLRAVFSTDFTHLKHRGYSLTPTLSLRVRDCFQPGWIGVAQVSGNFADRPLNAYFYDVKPEFARVARQAYDARSGYIGSDLIVGMVVPLHHRFRVFFGGQLNTHSGSANADSPLYRKSLTGGAYFGFGWTFYESKKPSIPLD